MASNVLYCTIHVKEKMIEFAWVKKLQLHIKDREGAT